MAIGPKISRVTVRILNNPRFVRYDMSARLKNYFCANFVNFLREPMFILTSKNGYNGKKSNSHLSINTWKIKILNKIKRKKIFCV